MERLTLDNMIKALKCVASQDTEGDCYADRENFKYMDDDEHKRIVCGTGENLRDFISGREPLRCPYYQKEYGYCFEDGDLFWLKDVAELLKELKELRSYKEKKEMQYLDDIENPLEPLKISAILEAVVGTIKKNIPQKPVGDLHSVPHYRCPNCKSGVVLYEDNTKFPYCQWCGQKLDWSEEDDIQN